MVSKKNQPSRDAALLAAYVREVYLALKEYVSLLSPNNIFLTKTIEEEAKKLKESSRLLIQAAKSAFSDGAGENNKKMETQVRNMITCIGKVSRALPSHLKESLDEPKVNTPVERVSAPSTSVTSPITSELRPKDEKRIQRSRKKSTSSSKKSSKPGSAGPKPGELISQSSQTLLSPVIPVTGNPTSEELEQRKQAYHNMLRNSRRSISLAKANVEAMYTSLKQAQSENEEDSRNRSTATMQNKLLEQALHQISLMENKMNDMEKKMEEEVKKGIPTSPDMDIMKMFLQLQSKLTETEEAIEREKRTKIELEKTLKQKELDMEEVIQKRLEALLKNMNIEQIVQKNFDMNQKMIDMNRFQEVEEKLKKLDAVLANAGPLTPSRGLDVLKTELEQLQGIIFNEKSTDKEKEVANVQLEKLMKEIEKNPEFLEEQKKTTRGLGKTK